MTTSSPPSAPTAARYGGGNQTGAMMGGIIIGDMLGGGGAGRRFRRRLGPDVVRRLVGLVRRRLHGRRRPVLNRPARYIKHPPTVSRGRVLLRSAVRANAPAPGTGAPP